MGDRGTEGTARRRRKPAAAEADRFPRELRASTRRLRQAPRAAAAPPPAALSSGPRLSGAEPAAPHLGLKSWKRPLRFMAENFTAAASSSPRPLHRAACALQRVHGARASRVPAAAAAAARNLSHRLSPPPLPGFRKAATHAPGRPWEASWVARVVRVTRDATHPPPALCPCTALGGDGHGLEAVRGRGRRAEWGR